MLRKRIIATVVIKNGWVVQSIAYKRYLPVGKVECVLENLDRWGVDEILIQAIDRSRQGLGPDFETLSKIASLGLSTPITYTGGIRHENDAVSVIKNGADRICVDSLLVEDVDSIDGISYALGAQAIVASFPVLFNGSKYHWLDYKTGQSISISESLIDTFKSNKISELLLIDTKNEGMFNSFNEGIPEAFEDLSVPMIVYGGISEPSQITSLLSKPSISAVAIGNFLNYTEHAVQSLKESVYISSLRKAYYEVEESCG